MINIHSVEYYSQWQLIQYGDILQAGPHVVCFLAQAVDFHSTQNIRPTLGPILPPVQWELWILPH